MSIWGRRDGEASDEETHEGQAEARESPIGVHESHAEVHDAQEPAAEHQDGEPAPAFWRAQGETPEPLERDPADAPPPDFEHVPDNPPPAGAPTTMGPTPDYAEQASGEAPAPAMAEAQTGTDAPVLSGVVVDTETAVKGPAGAEQPAVAPESAATELEEPTVAVAHEPVVSEAQEPATEPVGEAQEPVMTDAEEAALTEPGSGAGEPAMTGTEQQAVAPEPTVTGAGQPAAATIAPQRWSEIMVAFVDDPHGSVKMAADAVDEAIEEFVDSVRARQRDLTATWQSAGADTEQLRTALREYRKLGQHVQQLDLGEKTGA